MYSVDWWLSRLEGVVPSGDGWKAICPAHPDNVASLSITPAEDGALVHCFAGCEYSAIVESIENLPWGSTESKPKISIKTTSKSKSTDETVRSWWVEYTGVPWESWQSWGTSIVKSDIVFSWAGTSTTKHRTAPEKVFVWVPPGAPSPPLWPLPTSMPKTIWLAEGETDTGVLRYLGLPAWGLTKGAGSAERLQSALRVAQRLGVETIVSIFDADKAGALGTTTLVEVATSLGLVVAPFDLETIIDPLLGEKDVRDFWLRTRDIDKARALLVPPKPELLIEEPRRVSLSAFLSRSVPPESWLVEKVWLREAIGLIVGAPKMGKSWLALDLAVSVASGTPFLGQFNVPTSGPVVLITKEDPDFLLQDRLEKIMIAKNMGGTVDGMKISFPQHHLPLHLDLSRNFVFAPTEEADLLQWLWELKAYYGEIALVVLDPILRMLRNVDEYKASEVGESVFSTASKIAKEFSSAVALVHHRSKGGADGKRSYGSVAFHAFSENTLYLLGEEPDSDGWVWVSGEYKSSGETKWAYRLRDLEERYTVETQLGSSKSVSIPDSIVEILRPFHNEGLSSDELATALPGVSDFIIRKTLKLLLDQGIVDSYSQTKSGGGHPIKKWFVIGATP